jgi:hypothetical protein
LKRQVSKETIFISETVKSRLIISFGEDIFKNTQFKKLWFEEIDFRNHKSDRWDDKKIDRDCQSKADKETKDCFGRTILA